MAVVSHQRGPPPKLVLWGVHNNEIFKSNKEKN